jgi:serine/threonine-protein kinase
MDTDGNVVDPSGNIPELLVDVEEAEPRGESAEGASNRESLTAEFDQTLAGGELTENELDIALSQLGEDSITQGGLLPSDLEQPVTRRTTREATTSEATTSEVQDDPGTLEERVLQKLDEQESRPEVDPLIGMVLGDRFEVMHKIGEGGMGAVYKAMQKGIGREVAVKVLLGDVARNKTLVRRFHLEALAISKLKHPNTIQIFDFGETDEGLLYIAMELLEGSTLQSLLEFEEVLSVQRAIRIARQMAQSLREAHGKEIVHRDLKPDNVFLTSVGEESDFVKVLDFGVAKLKEQDKKGATVTKTGTIFGTPRYMSPEQAKGKTVDARGDLYAIGIMLYEMVMGYVPFESDNHLGVLILHVQKAPATFQEMRPDIIVPPKLEALVFKLLAKDPDHRYQTAEALIRALEQVDKSLEDIFRLVVRRKDALAHGLDVAAITPTSFDTRMDSGAEQALSTLGPFRDATITVEREGSPAKRSRWLSRIVGTLTLSAALAGAFVALLQPLPMSYHGIPALAVLDVGVQPAAQVPWAQITIASDPAEAQALRVNAKGEEIDMGPTPLSLRRHRGAAPETYAFIKKGFKRYQRTFEFNTDLVETVRLTPDKPIPPPGAGKVRRSTGAAKAPAPGASSPKKPFEYDPGKVGNTKSSPY